MAGRICALRPAAVWHEARMALSFNKCVSNNTTSDRGQSHVLSVTVVPRVYSYATCEPLSSASSAVVRARRRP